MKPEPRGLIASLLGIFLLLSAPASVALAAEAGGVSSDAIGGQTQAGGVQSGAAHQTPAGGARFGGSLRPRPGLVQLRGARLEHATVTTAERPALLVSLERPGARSARLKLVFRRRGAAHARTLTLPRARTTRTVRLRIPARAHLRAGSWTLRVIVLGSAGEAPVRSTPLRLTIRRPAPKPRPVPAPAAPQPQPPVTSPPLAPVPGGSAGVFPVQGAYSFGGADARFGAGRPGHIHQGQDMSAAAGVPVVAPVAGTVLFNDYQASGAGRYVVLHADDGRDMFFAHCLAGSATSAPGVHLSAGGPICAVGATGDATGPHLHFELWPSGWRQIKGTSPIDPLPQLRAWAAG